MANVVHNTIVSNCLPTALLVARDIKLPPPFPLPHITVQKKGTIKAEQRRLRSRNPFANASIFLFIAFGTLHRIWSRANEPIWSACFDAVYLM